jgi:hypothetical protein
MDAGLGLPGRIILACQACDTARKFLLCPAHCVFGLGPGRLLVCTTCGICAHLYIPHILYVVHDGRGGWCIYGAASIYGEYLCSISVGEYTGEDLFGSTILASIISVVEPSFGFGSRLGLESTAMW